jgi:hypothetical protein
MAPGEHAGSPLSLTPEPRDSEERAEAEADVGRVEHAGPQPEVQEIRRRAGGHAIRQIPHGAPQHQCDPGDTAAGAREEQGEPGHSGDTERRPQQRHAGACCARSSTSRTSSGPAGPK